jgi:hypothetical protein
LGNVLFGFVMPGDVAVAAALVPVVVPVVAFGFTIGLDVGFGLGFEFGFAVGVALAFGIADALGFTTGLELGFGLGLEFGLACGAFVVPDCGELFGVVALVDDGELDAGALPPRACANESVAAEPSNTAAIVRES